LRASFPAMRTIGLILVGFVLVAGCGDDGTPPASVDAGRADAGCAPYVGVGFTLRECSTQTECTRPGEWAVAAVYVNTDAQAKGLKQGMWVSGIGGQSIGGLEKASVDALLEGHDLGQDVTVEVTDPITSTFDIRQVKVENVQPTCP
jgi:hypothetical protein